MSGGQAAQSEHKEPEPLRGATLIIATMALAIINFLIILDTTIANVAIPSIAGELGASPYEGTWVITSYQVAQAVTVPLTGWIVQRFGTLRSMIISILSFSAMSLLCGLATSLPMLVVFRILQGLCSGPTAPLSQTLLLRIFPKEQRGLALSLWVSTTTAAPIIGPLVGGTLTEYAGWHWIFYFSVPVALACAVPAWTMLQDFETKTARKRIDYIGLILLILWVGSLQILLDKGGQEDWFESDLIVTLAIVAAISFVVFLIWELTDDQPIVDLRVFRHRSFTICCVATAIIFGLIFATSVLLSLWMQTDLYYTAEWAGYAMAFTGFMAMILNPFVAQFLMPRMDLRHLAAIGALGYVGLSLWRASTFSTDVTFGSLIPLQLAHGLFTPFFFVPVTVMALFSLAPSELASATSLMNFVRITAASFATSIATTAWTDAGALHRADLVAHVTPYDPQAVQAVTGLANAGMSLAQATAVIDRLVDQQAIMLATNHLFVIAALLFGLASLTPFFIPKPKR